MSLCYFSSRLLIKNGNSIDAATLYDSYEVEYLPNEGLLSTSRHLFIELTTDATGTSTGIAVRYQGNHKSYYWGTANHNVVFVMIRSYRVLIIVTEKNGIRLHQKSFMKTDLGSVIAQSQQQLFISDQLWPDVDSQYIMD